MFLFFPLIRRLASSPWEVEAWALLAVRRFCLFTYVLLTRSGRVRHPAMRLVVDQSRRFNVRLYSMG